MSLVALKRKSAIKQSRISSQGNQGFSLNNPRRVNSHSNQTQTQTPMKGTAVRGHGTCCGKFPMQINKSQYVNYDPHVRDLSSDKSNTGISVKNHHGSMAVRHKWIKRGYPHYIVKDMEPMNYETYISNLAAAATTEHETGEVLDISCNVDCKGNKKVTMEKNSTIVKNLNTMSHSEYLKSKYLKKNCLPTPLALTPYPVPKSGPCVPCGGTGIPQLTCD